MDSLAAAAASAAGANTTTASSTSPPLPLDPASLFVLGVTLIVFVGPLFVLFPPWPPRTSDALAQTHTKLGTPSDQSTIDKHQPSSSSTATGTTTKIASLFIYPIKSCRGIEVPRARVLPQGLEFDRLFTLAQLKSPFPVSSSGEKQDGAADKWDFITQRQFPRLATLQVELWQPDLAKIRKKQLYEHQLGAPPGTGTNQPLGAESFLLVRFPWRKDGVSGLWEMFAAKCMRGWRAEPEIEVLLPVSFPDEEFIDQKRGGSGYVRDKVRVWGKEVDALDVSCEVPRELALYLGVSNRLGLFRVDPERLREVGKCAPGKEEAGYEPVVGFQDSYPVNIMNLASVRDVESKIRKDVDLQTLSPRRFRANIFITGPPAYDEDDWKKIKFHPQSTAVTTTTTKPKAKAIPAPAQTPTFHVSCRTTRCKLPNVDQDTGLRHRAEPDRTLRAERAIDEGAPGSGCLGMQMTPLFAAGEGGEGGEEMALEVGMALEVVSRGEHFYKRG